MNELIQLHIAALRSRGLSKRTVGDARDLLVRLDAALQLGLAVTSRAEIEKFLGNEAWSDATRETYYGHASRFYNWATEEDVDLLDHNPMARMKRPHARKGTPRPLSPRELEIVFTRAAEPYRLCAVIAYETGLRCCEIAGLRKADVGEEDVYIRKAKGGGSATVPGRPEGLLEAIRDLPEGLLVESVGGVADARWISIRSAVHFRRKLDLPGVSLHRLRHTYAKRLRDGGSDAFVLKRQLRHSSLTSTEIYAGATDEECRQAVRGLTTPFLTQVAS